MIDWDVEEEAAVPPRWHRTCDACGERSFTVVVASCLPLSGVYSRGCLAKRDAALGQSVEAIQ